MPRCFKCPQTMRSKINNALPARVSRVANTALASRCCANCIGRRNRKLLASFGCGWLAAFRGAE